MNSADLREVWKRLAAKDDVVGGVFCRCIEGVTSKGFAYIEPFVGSAMQGCRE